MAKALGSPMWLLGVWLAMGAMALCGALCYGELSARYPEAGGGYVYLREAYGPAVAFMFGWMAFLVMDPGLTAALAVGLATYAGYGLKLSLLGIKILAVATIVVVALINIRGVRLGAGFIRTMTFIKLGLLAFVFLCVYVLRTYVLRWTTTVVFMTDEVCKKCVTESRRKQCFTGSVWRIRGKFMRVCTTINNL